MTDVTRPISQKVSVADPGAPSHVIRPTAAGAVPTVSGSGEPISSEAGVGNLVSLDGATDASGTLSFTANAQYAVIDTQGFEGAAFTISGFGTATLAVQWSNLAASGFVAGLVGTVGTTSTANTITANGQYTAAAGGRYLKILVTAFTTGPIVVTPVLIAGSSVGGSGGGASGDVNLTQVAGTAVTAGAGAVTAGTQRTTLASDDPAVASLAALEAAAESTTPVLMPAGGTGTIGNTAEMNDTSAAAVSGMGAPGASTYNYISTIVVSNTNATVGTIVEILDGSGGAVLMRIPAAANYGGATVTLPVPMKQPTANTALYARCAIATPSDGVYVSAVGYTGA